MANDFKKALTPIGVILALFISVSIYYYKYYGSVKSSPAPQVTLKLGELVPNIEVQRLSDKKIVHLYDLNSKVVWLHFWATWCQSCVVEMPAIDRVWKKYQNQGLELIAISFDDDPFTDVPPLIRKIKTTFPIYWNPDKTVSEVFDISFIPLSVLVGADHKILWVERGDGDWDSNEMHEIFSKWLKQ